jgi:hypothetical protein
MVLTVTTAREETTPRQAFRIGEVYSQLTIHDLCVGALL